MSTTIETLELEIVENSKSALNGIDALINSLGKLKSATVGKLGLAAVVKEIDSFNGTNIDDTKSKMVTLSAAISTLSNLPKVNLSGVINPLKNLPKTIEGLTNADMGSLYSVSQELVSALAPLSELPKSNLSSYITSLGKIPKVLEGLNEIDMGAFADKMHEVATAMKPLADEMEKVSNGFSAMPTKIQKLIQETDKVPASNKNAAYSFTDLYHKIKAVGNVLVNVGKKIWSTIEKSSDYTETLNLFTVSMGSYADEAKAYAEQVSEAMGIDTKEWMEAQGIFMTLATGFGVAGDRANTMSRNLTQLSYDLASFYNMDVDTAFLKLKSGLAGELEPLRAIGYDLSQAKLEATALELGITKSIDAMTQAEKAELRYYAIMTQVTQTHGDMAKTLDDPANQLRVLKAETNMAAREIGNLFIPALNAILPYAIAAAKVIGYLATSIASIFGTKDESVEKATESVVESTASMASNLEESQKEAKKLKSYMLGIDELNVINPNTDDAADGSAFAFPLPDYQTIDPKTGELRDKFLDGIVETKVASITESMKEWLGITEEIKSWTDLLSTNFGNILVAVGLIGVGITAWKIGALVTDVDRMAKLMATLSKSMSLLGIALKAMGVAAVIAAATAGAAWLIKSTDDTLTKIGALVSAASLGVGAILAFTGVNIPLGIALMAVGAVAMGSAIAMNINGLSDEIKGVIATITSVVSVALLAVGAVLAFTGVNVPLGIALMAGGALTLATTVVPNWNYLVDALRSPIGLITSIVSGALLATGIILLISGVGIPIGLALLAAGAVGLVTVAAVNWNTTVDVVKTVFSSILAIVSGALLVIGVLLLLSGGGIGLGLALIAAGLAGSFVAWKLDDNPVTRFVKKMANGIISIMNGVIEAVNEMFHIQFDGPKIGDVQVIPAFDCRLLNIPKIPLMAEGAYDIPSGQLFVAREAGAEMVGSIGRRTAVANNDQIVAGIAGGVASANEEQNTLLREQNSLLRAILEKDSGVYLDGKHLTNSVEKYQRERGRVLITGGVV